MLNKAIFGPMAESKLIIGNCGVWKKENNKYLSTKSGESYENRDLEWLLK